MQATSGALATCRCVLESCKKLEVVCSSEQVMIVWYVVLELVVVECARCGLRIRSGLLVACHGVKRC